MDKKDLLKLFDNISQDPKPAIPEATFNKHDRVLIIDGLNLFLRNFAVLNYVNQDGTHVGGLGGFLRSLGSLINNNKPTSVYIVFDGVGSSLNRKNLLPEYKSGRNVARMTNHSGFENLDDEQDSKVNQIARLIHYLKCLPVNLISIDKVEADDIIAYLTNYMSTKYNSKCTIVSADKDFLQLVNNNITVYSPMIKEYYTPKLVKEKFGLPPQNFILYKTLMGDNSDKIEGVQGLGPKKLFKLFPELATEIMTLEDILDVSASKHKDNIIYSRVVFEEQKIRNNYKIMDLGNPLMDADEKLYVETIVEQPVEKIKVAEFLKMYNEDGIGNVLKNVEYWIRNTFTILSSFK
jgi:5'-3' exonuclease